jgi:hypothetical protein
MKTVLETAFKNNSDIFRHILKVPFVDKSIDLPGFFVSFVRGICVVNNADETNTPNRE